MENFLLEKLAEGVLTSLNPIEFVRLGILLLIMKRLSGIEKLIAEFK